MADAINRRKFLAAVGAGTGGLLSHLALQAAESQSRQPPSPNFFPGFQPHSIKTSGADIHIVTGGSGPPVLLLHGAPQTHIIWRKIAPHLARNFTVVAADLRGYGSSSKPISGGDHSGYSKRAMAQDQIEVMKQLGFARFSVVGHDRGGRVAHRMALDHPDAIQRIAVLDIVPTYKLYTNVTREFATAYYHWFFLIQPAPMPEKLIGNSLKDWLFDGSRPAWMEESAYNEYLRALHDPAALHALCEDYRAGATIDMEHDAADLTHKIGVPLLALWGSRGSMDSLYNVLDTWKERAANVQGKALNCGHFMPEQAPDEVLSELLNFLGRH